MTIRDDLDRQLGSWFEAEATADGAASLLERTLAVTSRRRPRPALAASIDVARPAMLLPIDNRTRTRLGYAALLAAAVALLVAAALFLAGQPPPPPSQPLGCVGEPPTLCGQSAGTWTSHTFLSGMTLTFPNDAWYIRETAAKLELKALPMTSLAELSFDPLLHSTSWDPNPDPSAGREVLAAWIERDPDVVVDKRSDRTTKSGLPMTTFHLHPVNPRACALLFVSRTVPDEHTSGLYLCHYAYRLHLLDLGGGHTLAILLTALDSQVQTLQTLDKATSPIVDSIRPPRWPSP